MEIMLAISILAVIGGIVVGVLTNTLRSRDMLSENDTVQRSVRVSMERIGRELQLAYLTKNTGAVNTYRTVFVAQNQEPVDMLWFASLSHRPLYRNAHECDQTEITVWGEQDPENPELFVLLHREAPRIDQEPDKDGVISPIAHGVRRFDVRFLDGKTGEWRETWDTSGTETPNTLPRAVQIILVISAPSLDEPGQLTDHTYLTTIMLDYAAAMTRSTFASSS